MPVTGLAIAAPLLFFFSFLLAHSAPLTPNSQKLLALGGENLAPWANGLLKFTPVVSGPAALAPDAKFPLVLAEKRTRRPDVLNKLKMYEGGWDITNRHYWASVAFTGFVGLILALVWFVSFGLALAAHHFLRWQIGIKESQLPYLKRICIALLIVFTCASLTGCILLSVGQDDFHGEVLDTLNFVVNQSDFTAQLLWNVTDFLSLAKTISVGQFYLPSDVQQKIDSMNIDLNDTATTLSKETTQNSLQMRRVLDDIRYGLIGVAVVMLCLSVLGFLFSIHGHKNSIHVFIMSGWLLVAITFLLCGLFVVISNVIGDTCGAMNEWVENLEAETTLSNVLPCVDERTTNSTLHQSKQVIVQLVNVVNTAIYSIINSNSASQDKTAFYNQSGPLLPALCCPYDAQLHDQQCGFNEVSFANASTAWQNYTCKVSDSNLCISSGRVTPILYRQLVTAVNVSYALDHFTPSLLNLQNCKFVRETFDSITMMYCPDLKLDLRMVIAGLALISTGVVLSLILWLLFANRPQREEVLAKPLEVKICLGSHTCMERKAVS